MAFGYIKTTVVGRLVADADLAYTGEGMAYLKFRLLSNLGTKNHERVEATSCVMWGPRAEKLAPHLTKGKAILIDGEPVTSSWEKDGQKHYRTEVRVENLTFVGGGGKPADGAADASANDTVDYE